MDELLKNINVCEKIFNGKYNLKILPKIEILNLDKNNTIDTLVHSVLYLVDDKYHNPTINKNVYVEKIINIIRFENKNINKLNYEIEIIKYFNEKYNIDIKIIEDISEIYDKVSIYIYKNKEIYKPINLIKI